MKSVTRYIAVFPDPSRVSQYLVDCKIVVEKVTNHPDLPNPTPPLSQVTAHIDILAADEQAARVGGHGAVEKRDASLAVLKIDMRLLKAYIQSVSDGRPPHEARTLIVNSGMTVSQHASSTKETVAAKRGDLPGRVVLDAKALPRPVIYRWQMSTDGETWTDLPQTFKSRTMVDGLAGRTLYYFRLQTMRPNGVSDWSHVISVVAL